MDKKETVRENIINILKTVKRDGMENLINDLDSLGYFKAPASTQYHLNYEGGLAEHSLNVYCTAMNIAFATDAFEFDGVDHDSIVIACLFHDIAKGNWNGRAEYQPNVLKSGQVSEKKPWVRDKERPKIDHSILGTHILMKYIQLTDDELYAITYHDGAYSNHWRGGMGGEVPLWWLLHSSDLFNARFVETKEG